MSLKQRGRYSLNWKEIRDAVVERDGNRCKTCDIPNHVWHYRSVVDPTRWIIETVDGWQDKDGLLHRMDEMPDEYAGFYDKDPTEIVLTVHHKGVPYPDGTPGDPGNKFDNRDENLEALCQFDHFAADRPDNLVKSKKTRGRNKHKRHQAAGNKPLLKGENDGIH